MAAFINALVYQTEHSRRSENGVPKPKRKTQSLDDLLPDMCRTGTRKPISPKSNRLSTTSATELFSATEVKTRDRNTQKLPTPTGSPSTPHRRTIELKDSRTTKAATYFRYPDARKIQTPPIGSRFESQAKVHKEPRNKATNMGQNAKTNGSPEADCVTVKVQEVKSEQPYRHPKDHYGKSSIESDQVRSTSFTDTPSSDDEEFILDNPSELCNKSVCASPKPKPKGSSTAHHFDESSSEDEEPIWDNPSAVSNQKSSSTSPKPKVSANKILERRAKAQKKTAAKKSPKSEVAKFFLSR